MDEELKYAMAKEREWGLLTGRLDGGSYCENASSEYKSARKVKDAYAALFNTLLEHSRSSYKSPAAK